MFLVFRRLLIVASIAVVGGVIAQRTFAAATNPLLPNAEGSYLQWTPSTGTTHYTLLDDPGACNGATDYVYTTTVGNKDAVAVNLSTVPDGAIITAINITPCASRNTLGSQAPTLQTFYRYNGTDSAMSASYNLPAVTTPMPLASSSFSGLSIVKSSTSTLQIGAMLASGTSGARLSQLSVKLTYTTSTPSGGSGGSATSTANVTYNTFTGPMTGQSIRYGVYLPDGYSVTNTQRYPVIYWLHGKEGNEQTGPSNVIASLKTAIANGQIPPVIMVFPYGGATSFYTNSYDGTFPIETMIIQELIPYIDANYLTQANQPSREIMGFSMGAFGALKFAAKYPDLFSAVVAYAPPMTDFAYAIPDPAVYESVFGNDPVYFEQNTPTYLYTQNLNSILAGGLDTRLVAGTSDPTKNSVDHMDANLTNLGLAHAYTILPGVPHAVGQYYAADNAAGFAFLGATLFGQQ
jgi:S-formylglutathione hydrolase FrmB